MAYQMPIQLRWADLDPNFHVRHSVYYDWGAMVRAKYLADIGLTARAMAKGGFGPILFREEATFRREIAWGDELVIDVKALKLRRDGSRFSFAHSITKQNGEILCARLVVEGAWIDTRVRKLTAPPAEYVPLLDSMPKAEGFAWVD